MVAFVGYVLALLIKGFYTVLAISGVIGVILVLATRADAFEVADRQPKYVWAALLLASAFALMLQIRFLSWAGIVIIGLYWFDVRPQINNILNGKFGW
ncbi:putative secreted protein [Corynebacterium kutscheri]|uniref:DUF2516 family protein n=1 Tax=Corynebacterium kutscheri TaxID=35755 RepID=A0A0F6QYB0_9CORY|nr:DUF2516 family protein [Corynebacterium kutscheri]AKE40462.1 Protein of unknown function (DUF2516) [Corynebacterium kutscheri]VEH10856.1 putative secreted protein [Corynebacterium kutscheri]VEH80667.1 putative secreted protein [Corynebacterium kutscheri]